MTYGSADFSESPTVPETVPGNESRNSAGANQVRDRSSPEVMEDSARNARLFASPGPAPVVWAAAVPAAFAHPGKHTLLRLGGIYLRVSMGQTCTASENSRTAQLPFRISTLPLPLLKISWQLPDPILPEADFSLWASVMVRA